MDRKICPIAGETPFSLRVCDTPLRGWARLDGDGPVGVFIHGFRSTAGGEKSLALARHAVRRGRSWTRFDLRAHGISGGEFRDFRISGALADLEAVLAWLDRPVVLIGSSLGGWLAALAAARDILPIRGLMLIAPAFDFVQRFFGTLPAQVQEEWRQAGVRRFSDVYDGQEYEVHYDVLADAQRHGIGARALQLSCPVRIVHGEVDEVVPVEISRRFMGLLKARSKTLTIVPRADHRLGGALPLLCSEFDCLCSELES